MLGRIPPGGGVGIRRRAAQEAIASFARESVDGVFELFERTYGTIPPESVDWLEDQLAGRINSFAASIGRQLEESTTEAGKPHFVAKGHSIVNVAAAAAIRDLSIRLAPIRIRVEQGITMPNNERSHQTTIYNVTGSNSRVNINSTDSSTNVVNIDARQLFQEMRQAVDGAELESGSAEVLRGRIDEMEAAVSDRTTFSQKYAAFVQVAASHMELFAPFLPALGQIMTGLFGG
jgi:hypothetical protein